MPLEIWQFLVAGLSIHRGTGPQAATINPAPSNVMVVLNRIRDINRSSVFELINLDFSVN